MSGNNTKLTDDDIRNLVKSPLDKRLDITQKIGKHYVAGGLDEEQKADAEKIFRMLLRDTEVEVRKSLAESLKLSSTIPSDVILALAKDINSISIPVLQFSEVLSDEDLISIIESTDDLFKQESIAKRKTVSENVSNALIETGDENVVNTLLHNQGTAVSEYGYNKIVEDFSDKEQLLESMIQRGKIPVRIMETLAEKVSAEIYKTLMDKYKASLMQLDQAVVKSKEVVAMKVIGMQSTEQEYYRFCQLMTKLHIPDSLMPISALCVGNFDLFEVCIARATKVPVLNVRALLKDAGNKGFKALYQRAGLPENLYDATEILVDVLRDLHEDLKGNGISLSKKVAHRIIGNMTMRAAEKGEIENLDYIITLIRHNVEMSEMTDI